MSNNAGSSISRRKMLVGTAAVGAAWAAPAIVRLDQASASSGSCIPRSVNWSSVTRSGSVYTASGTSGTTSVTATVTRNLSARARPSVFISSGRLVLGMRRHQIGDNWVVNLAFNDSAGGIVCQASTTILDIDRNGRGLSPSCSSNSRFEDNIDQLSGPGLVTSTFGNLIETPAGNFVSSLNCKTTNTENLGLSWSSPGTVTGATFRWRAGTPPGNNTRLDYQVIQVQPMTLCVVPGANSGRAVAYPSQSLKPITTADEPADD